MTKRETTSLLVKLMGIYCLVQFAPSLVYVLGYIAQVYRVVWWQGLLMLLFAFLVPSVWIGLCILVIRKSDSIAKRLYREDSDASQLTSLGFQEVQTLGYNFIGLLLLVQSFPQIVSLLTSIKAQQVYVPQYWTKAGFYLNTLPRLLSFLTQFILGWILFLKPKGLANLWQKSQVMKYERVKPDNKALESNSE